MADSPVRLSEFGLRAHLFTVEGASSEDALDATDAALRLGDGGIGAARVEVDGRSVRIYVAASTKVRPLVEQLSAVRWVRIGMRSRNGSARRMTFRTDGPPLPALRLDASDSGFALDGAVFVGELVRVED